MSSTRVLHKFASPFLYKSGLYQHLWRARNRNEAFSFVVIYHRVVEDNPAGTDGFKLEKGISAANFERQMRFLLRHFDPAPASRIQLGLGRDIRFAVTLDDGYEDNYRVAAPILKRLGIPATFYVVSDFVGSDRLFWWEQLAELMRASKQQRIDMRAVIPDLYPDGERKNVFPLRNLGERDHAYEQLCARIRQSPHEDIPARMKNLAGYFEVPIREEGRRFGLMSWRQLKDLVGQGFEIGGHSASHCNVVGAGEDLLRRELIASTGVIESKIDAPVESFAYPYGIFETANKLVGGMLEAINCKAAFTTLPGAVSAESPPYELPRLHLNRPYDFACAFNLQEAFSGKTAAVA